MTRGYRRVESVFTSRSCGPARGVERGVAPVTRAMRTPPAASREQRTPSLKSGPSSGVHETDDAGADRLEVVVRVGVDLLLDHPITWASTRRPSWPHSDRRRRADLGGAARFTRPRASALLGQNHPARSRRSSALDVPMRRNSDHDTPYSATRRRRGKAKVSFTPAPRSAGRTAGACTRLTPATGPSTATMIGLRIEQRQRRGPPVEAAVELRVVARPAGRRPG